MFAEKLNRRDWLTQLGDVIDAIADDNATIERYNGNRFAVFDDGEIFPLTDDSRKHMNTDIAYYRENPTSAIVGDYCLSAAESIWRFAVGGIADPE